MFRHLARGYARLSHRILTVGVLFAAKQRHKSEREESTTKHRFYNIAAVGQAFSGRLPPVPNATQIRVIFLDEDIAMTLVGHINSLWRYPVKSMRGEQLDQAFAGFAGIYGDRIYAFHSSGAPPGFPYL